MPALTVEQLAALVERSTFNGPAVGRFAKGIRDASAALAKILTDHQQRQDALPVALKAFLADGPAWDSSDYEDGGACVHDDVASILDKDREVIDELLAQAAESAEAR